MTQPRGTSHLVRVLVAFGLFAVVEFAVWVAVLLWAYARGGAGLAALAGVLQLLPAAVIAPLGGSLGDRLPRGTALVIGYGAEALSLAGLAATLAVQAPTAVVIGSAAIVTTVVSVCRPVHYAALPQLASSPKSLVGANSASGVLEGVGVFAGPVVAGLVAAIGGPWLVPLVAAFAMLLAALLSTGLSLPAPIPRDAGASTLGGALDGMRQVSRDRAVLAMLLLTSLSFFIAAALEVLGIAFAYQVLGAGDAASGLLLGAVGLGAIVGAAAATGLAFRARLAVPFVVGLMLAGVPLVAMVATRSLGGATTLLALCGLGQAFSVVAGRTLLQRTTDDAVLARVLAVQEAVMLLGLALGAAVAPLLLRAFGDVGGFAALGVLLVALALISLPLVRALDDRAVFRPDVLAALRRVDFLAAMAPPALDRLSHHAEWFDVARDEVVVAQGDDGDAFFVVDSGVLAVTVDGVLRDHRLAHGDGFGEIALLRGSARTATITTLEPGRLLRIERDDFLAAITGSAEGQGVAEAVAAAHLHRDDDLRRR